MNSALARQAFVTQTTGMSFTFASFGAYFDLVVFSKPINPSTGSKLFFFVMMSSRKYSSFLFPNSDCQTKYNL